MITTLGTETFFQLALQYGIFCALFVGLLIYEIRTTGIREKEYQNVISKLNTEILTTATCNGTDIGSLSKQVDIIHGKLNDIDKKVDDVDRKVDGVSIKVDSLSNRV